MASDDSSEFTDLSDVSYYLPDLIIESALREGFAAIKRNPDIIDHVFQSIANSPSKVIREKYGKREHARIKKLIQKYDWSFVSSFSEVETNLPCVSIQLLEEAEAKEVGLEDFEQDAVIPLKDTELAALVILNNLAPTSYNQITGAIFLPDSADLSNIHANHLFVDATGTEFNIVGGIVNISGQKQVMVQAGSEVTIGSNCQIKSAIDFKQITIRGTTSDVNILLGVHTKDALLTKYFYILVKYILAARKEAMIEAGLLCSKYRGSDFTRKLDFEGDTVFNRFLTVSGKIKDSFRSDETQVFDVVDVTVLVPKDEATTEDLGLQDKTIQVGPDSQDDV